MNDDNDDTIMPKTKIDYGFSNSRLPESGVSRLEQNGEEVPPRPIRM